MSRLRSAWELVTFVVLSVVPYMRWAWARHRGRLPARGAPTHEFAVYTRLVPGVESRDGDLEFHGVRLTGRCSGIEAARLFGFAAIYETPPSAIVVRGDMNCSIEGHLKGAFTRCVAETPTDHGVDVREGGTLVTGERNDVRLGGT